MSTPLEQHQAEIQLNRRNWESKPLLRKIYSEFYEWIVARIDLGVDGRVVEIGSGIGNLREHYPEAIATDLFSNPWLDLVCDGYELPFKKATISNLILFDVFHHLEAPAAFFKEARRVLAPEGQVIIFDPFISLASWLAYGVFHHQPVAWKSAINLSENPPKPRRYYAAQGNATRLFFKRRPWTPDGWRILERVNFAAFAYLLSGGFSKPALYPSAALGLIQLADRQFSVSPRLFGARCLVTLQRL